MNDTTRRTLRLFELMDEQIRIQSPQERDRRMQTYLAQAKTPRERFKTLGVMMNFVIALKTGWKEDGNGG